MSVQRSIQERAEALAEAADQEFRPAWKPDRDDDAPNPLVGEVVGFSKAHTADYGEKDIATIRQVDTGDEWAVWLLHAALVAAFAREKPVVGDLVFIRFDGVKVSESSGRQYKAYSLKVERQAQAPDYDRLAEASPPRVNDDGEQLEGWQ
jgi:hypothetical protein